MTCGASSRPTLLHLHLPHYIYIEPHIFPPWGHIRRHRELEVASRRTQQVIWAIGVVEKIGWLTFNQGR